MVDVYLKRQLGSNAWQSEKLTNISGCPNISLTGSSTPTIEGCQRTDADEFRIGSACYDIALSDDGERHGTITIETRTDEFGEMIDTDVKIQDNDIKKNKEIMKDFAFHNTPSEDVKNCDIRYNLVFGDNEVGEFAFEEETIKEAVEIRKKERKQSLPEK